MDKIKLFLGTSILVVSLQVNAAIIYGQIDGSTGSEFVGSPPYTYWTWSFSYDSLSYVTVGTYDNTNLIDRTYRLLTPISGSFTINGIIIPMPISNIDLIVNRESNTLISLGLQGGGGFVSLLPNGNRVEQSSSFGFSQSTLGPIAEGQFIESDPLNILLETGIGCFPCGFHIDQSIYNPMDQLISHQMAAGELFMDRIRMFTVPTPHAIWLFAIGLISLIGLRKRKERSL